MSDDDLMPVTRECGTGGPGRGHMCYCVMTQGHMNRLPAVGHGCPCGAVWGRRPDLVPDVTDFSPDPESAEAAQLAPESETAGDAQ